MVRSCVIVGTNGSSPFAVSRWRETYGGPAIRRLRIAPYSGIRRSYEYENSRENPPLPLPISLACKQALMRPSAVWVSRSRCKSSPSEPHDAMMSAATDNVTTAQPRTNRIAAMPYFGDSTISICRPSRRGKPRSWRPRRVVLHTFQQVHAQFLMRDFTRRGSAG